MRRGSSRSGAAPRRPRGGGGVDERGEALVRLQEAEGRDHATRRALRGGNQVGQPCGISSTRCPGRRSRSSVAHSAECATSAATSSSHAPSASRRTVCSVTTSAAPRPQPSRATSATRSGVTSECSCCRCSTSAAGSGPAAWVTGQPIPRSAVTSSAAYCATPHRVPTDGVHTVGRGRRGTSRGVGCGNRHAAPFPPGHLSTRPQGNLGSRCGCSGHARCRSVCSVDDATT